MIFFQTLLIALTVTISPNYQNNKDIPSIFRSIEAEVSNCNYQKAISLAEEGISVINHQLERASAQDTLDLQGYLINLYLIKSQSLRKIYKIEEAITVISSLQKITQEDPRVFIELAECNKQIGDLNEALKSYEVLMEMQPDNLFFKLEKVSLMFRLKDWEGTIEFAEKILENDTIPQLFRVIGDSYDKLGMTEMSFNYYAKLYEIMPSDHLTVSRIARLMILNNQIKEALELLVSYTNSWGKKSEVLQLFALALHMDNQFDSSNEIYMSLIEDGDQTFSTYYYAGLNHFNMKRYYQAVPFFNMALNIAPESVNTIYYLGAAECYGSDIRGGIEMLNEGIKLLAQDSLTLSRFYSTLSMGYSRLDNVEEAIKAIDMSGQFSKDPLTAIYNRATVYDRGKMANEALFYYREFVKRYDEARKDDSSETSSYYRIAQRRIEVLEEELFWREK